MLENDWSEIERVVGEALELPEPERRVYIENAGLPHGIRRRAESLLDACRRSDGYLEEPPVLLDLAEAPAGERVGSHCGSWRLTEVLGSGGMGTVYRAERDDQQFSQVAAVKVIGAGPVGTSLERRFREERQILARLEHPNIARLIDGGVANDGSSYLVMEYVDGAPIGAWCRERSLDTRDRLRLFRKVCEAVGYAHQNLVVHCDLKSGNILITPDGVPKLLDFGIARFLARDDEVTATLWKPMTPDYASPEQIRGVPLSIASDIYSLGVLLYELLTGNRPYRLAGKTLDEVLEIVCEREPEKPQTGAKDLDAIVLKAMRKEPARRYSSAGELSADIGRYLDGLPVEAQPPSAGYVLGKFVARHRAGVAVAALVVLFAAVAGGVIFRQSRIAEQRFDQVRQLAHFMIFDLHDAVRPLAGSTPVRKMMAAQGLEYLDKLAASAGGDESLQRELGLAYLRLGDVSGKPSQANLGDSPGAIRSYRKALALLEPLYSKYPADLALGRAVARIYQNLSEVYNVAQKGGAEAHTAAEMVLRVNQKMAQASPGADTREGLAIAYFTLANVDANIGRRREALEGLQQATRIFEDLLAEQAGDATRQRNAALGHKYIASLMVDLGDAEHSEPHLERAEELDSRRVDASPSNRQAKLDLSFDYSQDGTFFKNTKHDYAAALDSFEKALAIREELSGSDPRDVQLRDRIAYLHGEIAAVLLSLKRHAEARDHAAQAVKIAGGLLAHEASPHNREMLAQAQETLRKTETATLDRDAR
ncbi:MAG TPA: serine/threonine-protein kinase [Bryobacteraceae bacterium]|nr:serine/threonine-protein kinase [Bryobacteraceae bacterium]